MKRILTLLLVIFMACSVFAGCSDNKETPTEAVTTAAAAVTEAAVDAAATTAAAAVATEAAAADAATSGAAATEAAGTDAAATAADTEAATTAAAAAVAATEPAATGSDAGAGAGSGPNIFRQVTTDEWITADIQQTTNDSVVPSQIYDTLIRLRPEPDGTVSFVPGLATEWSVTDDGLIWTMKLRENVKFHNGEIFKADDVKYTIERMMDPAMAGRWPNMYIMIEGAQEMLDGAASEVSGVVIKSDYEIEFHLTEPAAVFLNNMAFIASAIYNRKATEEAGLEFGINPEKTIGTGAYRYTEWLLNDHHRLEAFDDYWEGRPKIDGIIYTVVPDWKAQQIMYEQGELDSLLVPPIDAQKYIEDPVWTDQVLSLEGINLAYLHINQRIEPFNDVRIRKALQLAIDRQALLDSPALYYGNGRVIHGIMPKGLMGYNPNLPEIPYDPDEAMRLMAEAGYPDGFEMDLTQMPSANAWYMTANNEIIQAQLAEVGIRATIKTMDSGSWYDVRAAGDLGSYNATWGADFNDPDNFFYTFFSNDGSTSRSYNITRTDLLDRVEAARYITDYDARVKEYQDLEIAIAQEEACWVPLYSYGSYTLVNPRLIKWVNDWAGGLGFVRDMELAHD